MRFQKQILGAEEKYPFEAFVCEVLNIARIAKAALHNCPGKSSLNVNPVRPSVCLSVSLRYQMSSEVTCLKSLNGRVCKKIGGCTVYTSKLKIV